MSSQVMSGPCVGGPWAGRWIEGKPPVCIVRVLPAPPPIHTESYIRHERSWKQRLFSLPWRPWERYTYTPDIPMVDVTEAYYRAEKFMDNRFSYPMYAWIHDSLDAHDPEVAREVEVRYVLREAGRGPGVGCRGRCR